jgi:hypothetical protein
MDMLALAAAVAAFGAAGSAVVPFRAPRPVRARVAVRVAYGTTPCRLPLRGARVVEGRRRIVITLRGRTPRQGERCIQVLRLGCAEVPLRRRVGRRRVVDGSGRRASISRSQARVAHAGSCRRVRRLR